ncbi:major vault protein [Lepeophtheirus salmonis]|uniref:major vault protein n=1 Tax=Lepeophtheirus salmonis TaxID=72036 RepID=UPI001AE27B87|nr:major vault protein-like [Lepeophtheirus salmonis]XP_040564807.1 major vault protein-like [Lepeophtheirus salmonis]
MESSNTMDSTPSFYRIPPFFYLHVLDQTTNVTSVEIGPQTYHVKEHDIVVLPPTKMTIIPPGYYCVVSNPVITKDDVVEKDTYGQAKLSHGDEEVRLERDPFPLYPGEELKVKVTPLAIVHTSNALLLKVIRNFTDENDVKRVAGDLFLFEGPGTYIPRKEVEVLKTITAQIIHENEALKLSASRETIDRSGIKHVAGEEWLIRKPGAYLPLAYENIVEVVKAHIPLPDVAILVRAKATFKDKFGVERKNGDKYLITFEDTSAFIPEVQEEIIGTVDAITLDSRQYCTILNPHDSEGKAKLGHRKIVKGEISFFLKPGEVLEDGINEVYILGEDEGIVLKSLEKFEDKLTGSSIVRNPGDRWMIKGPMEYTPTVEVEVVDVRKAIPLHQNEGIYVRNIQTGSIRSVIGKTYMLKEDEELWEKDLSSMVQTLLNKNRDVTADRGEWINPEKEKRAAKEGSSSNDLDVMDMTKVITFKVPHNAAVQVYDYKSRQSRVVYGPDLVLLEPNEEFTQLSLSGGKPKRANLIRSLALLLGPDFCSDNVTVETADHARLELKLSYNWQFQGEKNQENGVKLFSVPDFIGDMCKSIASKVRGAVSSVSFDYLHKNSAQIIILAVFGKNDKGQPNEVLEFKTNNLIVTSIDIRSVEPVDQRTRDSLQKSVTLAIEITTQSQEATAKREAERVDQEARGRLERQKITDEAEAEKSRKQLLELQAESAIVEAIGHSSADAKAQAEAAKIEADSNIENAKRKTEALAIEAEAELNRLKEAREAEIQYIEKQNKLEIEKKSELMKIEVEKFNAMVEAVGPDTILSMSALPRKHQIKMLESLGLKSTLITDGKTPINLIDAAKGLVAVHQQSF